MVGTADEELTSRGNPTRDRRTKAHPAGHAAAPCVVDDAELDDLAVVLGDRAPAGYPNEKLAATASSTPTQVATRRSSRDHGLRPRAVVRIALDHPVSALAASSTTPTTTSATLAVVLTC